MGSCLNPPPVILPVIRNPLLDTPQLDLPDLHQGLGIGLPRAVQIDAMGTPPALNQKALHTLIILLEAGPSPGILVAVGQDQVLDVELVPAEVGVALANARALDYAEDVRAPFQPHRQRQLGTAHGVLAGGRLEPAHLAADLPGPRPGAGGHLLRVGHVRQIKGAVVCRVGVIFCVMLNVDVGF